MHISCTYVNRKPLAGLLPCRVFQSQEIKTASLYITPSCAFTDSPHVRLDLVLRVKSCMKGHPATSSNNPLMTLKESQVGMENNVKA